MDPISDMLIRIKNAQAVNKDRTVIPFSKAKHRIAAILKEEGYLTAVELRKHKAGRTEHEVLEVALKYQPSEQAGTKATGAISGIRLVSKPSRRLYTSAKALRPVRSGYGTAIITTPKGIMTSKQARKENVGGEVMFEIW
jgi:small subunit ribosomal protein S8